MLLFPVAGAACGLREWELGGCVYLDILRAYVSSSSYGMSVTVANSTVFPSAFSYASPIPNHKTEEGLAKTSRGRERCRRHSKQLLSRLSQGG